MKLVLWLLFLIPAGLWAQNQNLGNVTVKDIHINGQCTGNCLAPGAVSGNVTAQSYNGTLQADQYCTTPGTLDQTCINNAIAALPANGGIIQLGFGTYTLASGVAASPPKRVQLKGRGAATNATGQTTTPAATHIVWAGAGGSSVMFMLTSTATTMADFNSISDMDIDCAGIAGYGIEVASSYHDSLNNLSVRECTTADVFLTTLDGRSGLDPGNANRNAVLSNLWLANTKTTGGRTGIGLLLDGNTADPLYPNTNYSDFYSITFDATDAPCLQINTGDSNNFSGLNCNVYPGGLQAKGFVLDGSRVGAVVDSNSFYATDPGPKGVYQQNGAADNNFYGYIIDNGSPPPVSTGIGQPSSYYSGNFTFISSKAIGLYGNVASAFGFNYLNTSTTLGAIGQMIGVALTANPTGPVNFQSDTAANICAAGKGTLSQGNGTNSGLAYDWWVKNSPTSTGTITITTNTGITLESHSTFTIATGINRHYKLLALNCAAGSEAISVIEVP